ncbi:tigger transposable element-derived protein 4 [Elysia marginata]|uniref:Tigger transposable element-derived protein 4 n=1 Tax=Elysia marginata TaxID=1093978 RepID=A0AAV4JEP1_9GAST|nr:tigger transposable element-derived protein 4 [Elysia marginata]
MAGRKLTILPLKRKIELIKAVESGKKEKVVADEFQIPSNSVSTIMKRKEHYRQQFYSGQVDVNKQQNLDQDVPTAPSASEEMNPSTTNSERENQTEQAADDEDDQGEEMPPVSDESVASAMETLSQYFMQRGISDKLLSKVKKTIEFQKVQSKKQTSLTSFFKRAPKNKQ